MSGITLPGYDVLIPNAVYGKDTGFVVLNNSGSEVGIKEVVLPKVYREATENDVVKYLQEKASESYGASSIILLHGHKRDGSILDQALKDLPSKVIADLMNKNEGLENFIRQNTKAPATQDAFRYLSIRIGLVPEDLVEKISDYKIYDALLSDERLAANNLGEALRIKMLLYEDSLYNDKSEIEVLLKHGTMISETLEINRRYEPKKVMELMDVLYSGLVGTDFSKSFPDSTQDSLDAYAIQPIIELHKKFQAAAITQQLREKR